MKTIPRGLPPSRRVPRPATGPTRLDAVALARGRRLCVRGNACLAAGDAAGALEAFRALLEIDPTAGEVRYAVGQAMIAANRPAEAAPYLRDGLAALGGRAPAHLGDPVARDMFHTLPARALLAAGDFAAGWPALLAACRRHERPPYAGCPAWDGRPLGPDRALLVRAGPAGLGLGDAIQFSRFFRRLRGAAGQVLVEVAPALLPFLGTLAGLPGNVALVGEVPGQAPEADSYINAALLAAVLDTRPEDWGSAPYLSADPTLVRAWGESLADLEGTKVGFVWTGSELSRGDSPAERRSIPPREFAALAAVPGVHMISLQLPGSPGWDEVPFDAVSLPQQAEGPAFLHTTAIMANLDLIVGLDSGVCHAAGALGRRTWLALPFVADFRWGVSGDRTAWYPGHRLYRQPSPGDWAPVFARMAADLEELARCRR